MNLFLHKAKTTHELFKKKPENIISGGSRGPVKLRPTLTEGATDDKNPPAMQMLKFDKFF